jgi:hypothetical protein
LSEHVNFQVGDYVLFGASYTQKLGRLQSRGYDAYQASVVLNDLVYHIRNLNTRARFNVRIYRLRFSCDDLLSEINKLHHRVMHEQKNMMLMNSLILEPTKRISRNYRSGGRIVC